MNRKQLILPIMFLVVAIVACKIMRIAPSSTPTIRSNVSVSTETTYVSPEPMVPTLALNPTSMLTPTPAVTPAVMNTQDLFRWEIELVEDSRVEGASVDLDSKNQPHISFISYSSDGEIPRINYAYLDETKWQREVVIEDKDICKITQLVLDSSDLPHIGYLSKVNESCDNDKIIQYAHKNGEQWTFDTVPIPPDLIPTHLSMALNSSDLPAFVYCQDIFDLFLPITYQYASHCEDILYANYDGTNWQSETIPGVSGAPYALVIDSLDKPHILYKEGSSLKYVYLKEKDWIINTVIEYEINDGGIYSAALALDQSNKPLTSFFYEPQFRNRFLNYAFYQDGNWIIEKVEKPANCEPYETASIDLEIDTSGFPHISYFTCGIILKYASFDGKSWNTEIIEGGVKNDISFIHYSTAIVLDSFNMPHIVYYIDDEEGGLYFLKYAKLVNK